MKLTKKSLKFIMVIVFMLFCTIALTGCSEKSEEKEESNPQNGIEASINEDGTYKVDIAEKNIEIESTVAADGNIVAIVKNNNSFSVYDVELQIAFKDKNDKTIDTDTDYIDAIEPGKSVACGLSYYKDEDFKDYEIELKLEKYYSELNSKASDLKIDASDNEEEIILEAKNTSDKDIDYVELGVVFYKDDTIVGYEYDNYTDLAAGKTAHMSVYYPNDKKYEDVDFDTFKVFINEAIIH